MKTQTTLLLVILMCAFVIHPLLSIIFNFDMTDSYHYWWLFVAYAFIAHFVTEWLTRRKR